MKTAMEISAMKKPARDMADGAAVVDSADAATISLADRAVDRASSAALGEARDNLAAPKADKVLEGKCPGAARVDSEPPIIAKALEANAIPANPIRSIA